MIDTSKEWILCAAIWYQDGTEALRGMIAQNINNGVVIGQYRHGNCINVRATNPLWNTKKLSEIINKKKDDIPMIFEWPDKKCTTVDGFLTSKGRFVDRWQGMEIAYNAGQVTEERAKNKDYKGILVSSEEFQKQEPHERYSSKDGNGWKMMYSEDLY